MTETSADVAESRILIGCEGRCHVRYDSVAGGEGCYGVSDGFDDAGAVGAGDEGEAYAGGPGGREGVLGRKSENLMGRSRAHAAAFVPPSPTVVAAPCTTAWRWDCLAA